jgi:glycosyltransferase involved in cell wall biosynthesis
MNILLVNKFYFPRGGAEACFFEEASLLEKKGHTVIPFAMAHPRNRPSPYSDYFVSSVEFEKPSSWRQKAKAAGRVLYSREAQRNLSRLLKAHPPDLAHLHNIYHQISPSIIAVLRRAKIPMVMTLHDYKFLCPVYTFYRGGRICQECRRGRFIHCLGHRCAKDSALKSAWSTLEMVLHHSILKIYNAVDCFICPSQYLQKTMAEKIDPRKLFLLPNFISDLRPVSSPPAGRQTIVYFGRLSQEKGLRTLLQALKGLDIRCLIVGEGPERPILEKMIRQFGLSQTHLLGFRPPKELQALIRESAFTVLPAEWTENSPRSVLESFALGRATVASRLGGLPELVIDRKTGLMFEAGDALDLRQKILDLLAHPQEAAAMGRTARQFVEEQLGPERHYGLLLKIYEIARARHH